MGISIQRRRGTTSQHSSFTGKPGEMTVDTSKWSAVVHDGSTVGGWPTAHEVHSHGNATDSTAGFMSSSDKTKLDSISGGTINYQTVQSNGTAQNTRAALNLSSNFAITDDSAGNRTTIDLINSGVSNGTYTKITVNSKGIVTGATLLSAGDIPNITSSQISDFSSSVASSPLNSFANPTGDVNLNSHKLINVATPISASDAANKQYVDSTATGLSFKAACRAASTGTNVNISAPGTSIDTVSLNPGDRVLLKDQTDATTNGIYIFNGASTSMTRSLDAANSSDFAAGMFILVTAGTLNANVGFVLSTTGTIVLGSTALTFVPFSSGAASVSAGNGISVSGSIVSVNSANTGRIAVGSGGVDLAIVSGLTPGTYSSVTIDAYGRVIATSSTTYQASNANLTAVAGLSASGFAARTGSGSFAARTFQPGTGIAIVNPDGVNGNPQISVVANTTVQQVQVSAAGSLVGTRQQINFISGSGATVSVADNSGANRVDVTISASGGGGGGGAPTTSQYLTLALDSGLSNERVLAVTAPIVATDGGANGNLTLSFQTDLGTVP